MIEAASVQDRSSLAVRLSKGFTWSLVAAVSNQGATFVGNVIVARLLGSLAFGEYAMVQATLVPLAMAIQLATSLAIAKHVAEYRSADPERAGRIVALCGMACLITAMLLGGLLLAVAEPLASVVLEAPQLVPCLMAGALFLICTSLSGYQIGILAGLEDYSALARAALASALITVAAIALGAHLLGLTGAVLGFSLSALLRLALYQLWAWRGLRQAGIRVTCRDAGAEFQVLYRFLLPVTLASTITVLMVWPANLVLVRQADGYGQLALYSAGLNIKSLAIFLPAILNTIILSVLNHLKGGGDWERYHRLLRINVAFTSLLAVFVAVTLLSAGDLVFAVFGRDFSRNASVLLPLLLASVCEATGTALNQPVQAYGKVWLSFLGITVPRDALFLWSTWRFAPLHGAWGMAWSFFAASCYFLVSSAALAWWIGRAYARSPRELPERQGA